MRNLWQKRLRFQRRLFCEQLENRHLLALTLDLAVDSVSEAPGGEQLEAIVTRDGDTSEPLDVNLATSPPSHLFAPYSVTIPAGQASVAFTLETVNNPTVAGPTVTNVTATASGHTDGTATVEVLDDDTLELKTIGGPLHGFMAHFA